MELKNKWFFNFDFSVFFSIFRDFGSNLGGPGGSKNQKKIEKIAFGTVLERVWDPVSILDTILERFWWILEGF